MTLTKLHNLLDIVNSPEDLKKLQINQLPEYCCQLRSFIVNQVAENPGHLGSSLGALELAVAVHYVFNAPEDQVIWDVGHQAYAHKIITGRKECFRNNRKWQGISGFPKISESMYDAFGAGHASTSISAALGIATGARLEGKKIKTIAIIGDGSMSGGLAFEAMNNIAKEDILVILNDNKISIDENVGALKDYLLTITTSRRYNRIKESVWQKMGCMPSLRRLIQRIGNTTKHFFLGQGSLFESFGFRYFGPTDGNNVIMLVKRLQDLKDIEGPKLLHILTTKGKGYAPAEKSQTEWHAPGKFDPETGIKVTDKNHLKYQDVFGYTITDLARGNKKIVGITPAMPTGSSLNIMMDEFPERTFDVGIAEGHAVTFAAGLAVSGELPFCCIYSTFSQRAIDNIIHDVALQNLEVVFCLDRAGLVGEDGATHQGVFDISCLRAVPNVIISVPSDAQELRNLLYTASLGGYKSAFIIRYPRGHSFEKNVLDIPFKKIEIGKATVIHEGTEKVAILAWGDCVNDAKEAIEKSGKDITLVNMKFVKPLDTTILEKIFEKHDSIITIEDGMVAGGAGSYVGEYINQYSINCRIRSLGVPDEFIEQGTVSRQKKYCRIDPESIADVIAQETQLLKR